MALQNKQIRYLDSNRIQIYWYSSSPGNSIIQWGETESLGEEFIISESTQFHTVELEELCPNTTYFYKVGTGAEFFDIDDFTTPVGPVPVHQPEILYDDPVPFRWWTPDITDQHTFSLEQDGFTVVSVSGIFPSGYFGTDSVPSGVYCIEDICPSGYSFLPSGVLPCIPSGICYPSGVFPSGAVYGTDTVFPTGIFPSGECYPAGILEFEPDFTWSDGVYQWFIKQGSETPVDGGIFTLNLPDPIASVSLSFIPESIPISSTGIARALVLETTGNPGAFREVLWGISEGSITSSSFTDENGIAEATITRTNNGGYKTVTAVCEGKTGTGQVYWEFGTPTTIEISTTKDTLQAIGTDQAIITGILKDEFGNAITQGYSLTFTCTDGSLDGILAPNPKVKPIVNGSAIVTYRSSETPGIITVTVSYSALEDNLDIELVPGAVQNIFITPGSASIVTGGTQQFSLVGEDKVGTDIPLDGYWTLADGSFGTLSESGLFTASAIGIDTVIAKWNTLEATALIEVTFGTPTSIELDPGTLTLLLNHPYKLQDVLKINIIDNTGAKQIFDVTDLTPNDITFDSEFFEVAAGSVVITPIQVGNSSITVTIGSLSEDLPITIVYADPSTMERHQLWNHFDEFGLLVGLKRQYLETNEHFRTRILDVYKRRPGPTYRGLFNHLARQLNLVTYFEWEDSLNYILPSDFDPESLLIDGKRIYKTEAVVIDDIIVQGFYKDALITITPASSFNELYEDIHSHIYFRDEDIFYFNHVYSFTDPHVIIDGLAYDLDVGYIFENDEFKLKKRDLVILTPTDEDLYTFQIGDPTKFTVEGDIDPDGFSGPVFTAFTETDNPSLIFPGQYAIIDNTIRISRADIGKELTIRFYREISYISDMKLYVLHEKDKYEENELTTVEGLATEKFRAIVDEIHRKAPFEWGEIIWDKAIWDMISQELTGLGFLPGVWDGSMEGLE